MEGVRPGSIVAVPETEPLYLPGLVSTHVTDDDREAGDAFNARAYEGGLEYLRTQSLPPPLPYIASSYESGGGGGGGGEKQIKKKRIKRKEEPRKKFNSKQIKYLSEIPSMTPANIKSSDLIQNVRVLGGDDQNKWSGDVYMNKIYHHLKSKER